MLGVIVNTGAILLGGLVGLLANKGVPKRFSDAIMLGIGLCVVYVGISGTLDGENAVILVVSIVLGAAIGTALDIDGRINRLGVMIENRFSQSQNEKSGDGRVPVAQGFVTASLLFCVGSMAIVGSITSGLTGDHTMLLTKSTLDGISAMMLAVSLGFGVLLSAVSVFVFQGTIVLLSQFLQPLMANPSMLAEMNCAGSIIIVALGLNMLGITKIKVADYLPAIILAPLLCYIVSLF